MRLLRDARLARLQPHVTDDFLVAIELVPQENKITHWTASHQQNLRAAVDDFHFGCFFVVAAVSFALERANTELVLADALLFRLELEFDRDHLTGAANIERLLVFLCFAAAVSSRGKQLDRDPGATVVLCLHVTSERELVAWINALGCFKIDDPQVGWPFI